jgi:hypothetical protein
MGVSVKECAELAVQVAHPSVSDASAFVQSHIRHSLRHCTLVFRHVNGRLSAAHTIPYRGDAVSLSICCVDDTSSSEGPQLMHVSPSTRIHVDFHSTESDAAEPGSLADPWSAIGGLASQVGNCALLQRAVSKPFLRSRKSERRLSCR